MNKGSSSITRAAGILAAAAIVLAGLSACVRGGSSADDGAASDPGITDTTITLGDSLPLSGQAGGPGACTLGGLTSYFESTNAEGGIKFGDGHTRTVTVESYDDAYDPAKAVANFRQMIADGVFADVGSLGTPANLAIMPIANQKKVPQVFLVAGTAAFSNDQKKNPWTIGWFPTYESEAVAFGKFLASMDKPLTVAVLEENDEVGEAYLSGLKKGIESSQVKIVAHATFASSDPSVDAQITKLAASGADVFFSANSVTPLTASSLLKAQQLGWLPSIFLTSVANGKNTVVDPGHGEAFPAIYTAAFSLDPTDPANADDPEVEQFMKDMNEYAPKLVPNMVPACVWGYQMAATLEAAFQRMKEPTRKALMSAIHELSDLDIPLMLPGITVDATSYTEAPINSTRIQQFVDGSYQLAEEQGN